MRKNLPTATYIQYVSASLINKGDGSPVTTGTTNVFISKDGAAQGAGGNTTATHKGNGEWEYALTQADSNANHLTFTFVNTSAINAVINVDTTAADPTDAVHLGLSALPNAAAGAANGILTVGTGANQVDVETGGVVCANIERVNNHVVTDTTSGVLDVNAKTMSTDAVSSAAVSSAAVAKIQSGTALETTAQTINNNVLNITNNTFISTDIPLLLERPDTGSVSVPITIIFSDETGAAHDLDSGNPAIALTNDSGTDLSSRIGSWTKPSTGKYKTSYLSSATDAIEGLHWDVTGTLNTKLRRQVQSTQIVDTTAVSFTAADRAKLTLITGTNGATLSTASHDDIKTDVGSALTSNNYTPARGLKLDNLDGSVSSVKALLPTSLIGGKMDSHINDIASGAITATALADSAALKIANANYLELWVAGNETFASDSNDGLTFQTCLKTIGAATAKFTNNIAGKIHVCFGYDGVHFIYQENVMVPPNVEIIGQDLRTTEGYFWGGPWIQGSWTGSDVPVITMRSNSALRNVRVIAEVGGHALDHMIRLAPGCLIENIMIGQGSTAVLHSVFSADHSYGGLFSTIRGCLIGFSGGITGSCQHAIRIGGGTVIVQDNTFNAGFASDLVDLSSSNYSVIKDNRFMNIPSGAYAVKLGTSPACVGNTIAENVYTLGGGDFVTGTQTGNVVVNNSPYGTTLTAQQIADSLKLAPTAGTPDNGSVYDQVNAALKLNTALENSTVAYALRCAMAMFNGDFTYDTVTKRITFKDRSGADFSTVYVPDDNTRTRIS